MGCRVGDASYPAGARDSSNACLACDPSLSAVAFADLSSTAPCGDGGSTFCYQGRCLSGCTVGGVHYGPGATDDAHICQRCDPATGTALLTPISGLARPGECAANQLCINGACTAGCFIGGTAVAAGALDPASECRSCQPDAGALEWSALSGPCSGGGVCYLGTCALGCVIQNASYPVGTLDPSGCASCQPAVSFSSWTPLSGIAPLGTCDGGEICDVGICRSGCWIANAYVPEGSLLSGNACTLCAPALSSSSWSPLTSASAGFCDAGQICALGSCRVACLIDGGVFDRGSYRPNDATRCCGSATTTTDWTPDFAGGVAYPGQSWSPYPYNPGVLEAADIDGDGRLDLASLQSDHLDVYYGLGGDRFGQPVSVAFPWMGTSYTSGPGFAIVDLNRDNLPDLVVLGNGWPWELGVMINLGDAGFAPMVTYAATLYPYLLSAADFNGDGFADVVVASDFEVDLLLNLGDGGLASPTPILDGGALTMLAGDFNGDGRIDLVALDTQRRILTVLYNDGSGGFASAPFLLDPNHNGGLYLAADFNGDGRTDIVAIGSGNSPNHSSDLQVILALPDGGFATSSYLPDSISTIDSADFNQDGHRDLIATTYGADVILLINRGDGTFLPGTTIDAGAIPLASILAGPFGDDATPDLALLNSDGGGNGLGLTIHRNGCR